MRNRHDKVSTYGIGLEYTKRQWLQLARQFLHQGLMAQDMEYGSLKLTAKSRQVFKGELKVAGVLEDDVVDSPPEGTAEALEYDRELFQLLRKKRKEIADRDDVPPYVVFPDKTLRDMAARFPHSPQSMLAIHGVGEARSARYGGDFTGIITEYCRAHGLREDESLAAGKSGPAPKTVRKRRYVEIGEVYNSGRSIDRILADYGVKLSTVIDHLLKYHREGNPLRADGLEHLSQLPDSEQSHVMEAFERLGCEMLNPVFKALNGKIGYDELHKLRLLYLARQKEQ